jgi:hypothetical protein
MGDNHLNYRGFCRKKVRTQTKITAILPGHEQSISKGHGPDGQKHRIGPQEDGEVGTQVGEKGVRERQPARRRQVVASPA